MGTLFIKEKEVDTGSNVLARIMCFLEQYAKKNNTTPDYVKISKKDLARIKSYNPRVISDNKILCMEIIPYTFRGEKNEFSRIKK